MMLFILKDGSVFSTIVVENDEANYTLLQVADSDIPLYPESEAGRGKSWELQHVDGVLTWTATDRELTKDERIEVLNEELDVYRYPAWVQPSGAHDAYQTGSCVSHNEKKWTSDVDGNVWEPGVYGWSEVTA